MSVRQAIGPIVLLLLLLAVAACGSAGREADRGDTPSREAVGPSGPNVGAAGSCILAVTYDGHAYEAIGVDVAPAEGASLGSGTLPPCNDTGDLTKSEEPEEVALAALQDVSPSIAILLRGRSDVVLVRDDVDDHALPPGVTRLLRAPPCDPSDEPLELAGPWLGILGADGDTELDLDPPYDLEMTVSESSAARYEGAHLTIRAPSSLGRPLRREDIRSSLWEGGTISLTVSCHGRDYVAAQVEAYPPA